VPSEIQTYAYISGKFKYCVELLIKCIAYNEKESNTDIANGHMKFCIPHRDKHRFDVKRRSNEVVSPLKVYMEYTGINYNVFM
jgi:hypothetical protein